MKTSPIHRAVTILLAATLLAALSACKPPRPPKVPGPIQPPPPPGTLVRPDR